MALGENGLLVQQTESPLMDESKSIIRKAQRICAAPVMSIRKRCSFLSRSIRRAGGAAPWRARPRPPEYFREADAREMPFPTRYYTADVHAAAMAHPPFLQEMIGEDRPLGGEG